MGTHYGYRPSGNSPYVNNTIITDPQFNYVSMLLHGDGTNGAQNNTFIDSSTNNFTITRNGNTTQGSLSPYGNLWSNYFDGSGDYLTVPNNTALNLSSGDWTIELWVWWNGGNSEAIFIDKDGVGGSTYPSYDMGVNGSGYARVIVGNGSANAYFQIINSGTLLPKQSWVHLAAVKSGSTITLYQNGVNVVSATQTGTIVDGGKPLYIGYQPNQPAYLYLDGYLSNVRIVKGTALYTSNFTPSTTPLTAVSGTSLLTCQSNRFIDNSANNFTITRNGDVRVTKEAPFLPTAAYSTSTIGGSGYFDGNGDYLTVPNTAAFQFGTGDFEIDAWVYQVTLAATVIIDTRSGATATPYTVGWDASGLPYIYTGSIYTGSSGIRAGQWNHVVWTRASGTLRIFVNGTSVYSAANSDSITGAGTNVTLCSIVSNGGQALTGYLCDLRIIKGAGVTSVTVPTAPLTAPINTSLLLNFTNAGIFDNAAENDLETVGNAQISTSVKKYGTGSIAFDGTGDALSMPLTPNLQLGAGNFTFEFWVYFNSTASFAHVVNTSDGISSDRSIAFFRNGTSLLYYLSSNGSTSWDIANGVSIGTVTTNTWYHVALVRNGSTFTPYLNGTAGTTTSSSAALFVTPKIYIGNAGNLSTDGLNGYIDDLRITKGYARYTANFTPPTAAFPDQ